MLAARDDRAELAHLVTTFAGEQLAAEDAAVVGCLQAVVDATTWERALAAIDPLPPQLRIELAHLAIRRGRLDAARRAEIGRLAAEHPIWRHRVAEL